WALSEMQGRTVTIIAILSMATAWLAACATIAGVDGYYYCAECGDAGPDSEAGARDASCVGVVRTTTSACNTCATSNCAAALAQCACDNGCAALLACRNACIAPPCDCAPDASALSLTLNDCVAATCSQCSSADH